jgi:ribosomal protein L17
MTSEKAKQIIRVLEKWIENGDNGKLKKYSFSEKLKTEKKIKELKKFIHE